jgi:membrane-associated protease RseP (regulator of RpoE activity)
LRRGDEILAINGRQVFSYRDVTRMVADHQPNDLIELSIGRNGRERTVEATLAGREVPNRPLTSTPGNYPAAPGAGGYYGPDNVSPGGYYSPRQARRARNAAIDPELYNEPYAY